MNDYLAMLRDSFPNTTFREHVCHPKTTPVRWLCDMGYIRYFGLEHPKYNGKRPSWYRGDSGTKRVYRITPKGLQAIGKGPAVR